MKIKRFTAANMQAGLKTIGETLGPEAVILSNRRLGNGIEIVAGVDEAEFGLFEASRPPAKPTSDIIKANPESSPNLDQETMQQLFAAMSEKNQQAFNDAGLSRSSSEKKATPSSQSKRHGTSETLGPAPQTFDSRPQKLSTSSRGEEVTSETQSTKQKEYEVLRREFDELKELLREQTEQLRIPVLQPEMSPQVERIEARLNMLGFSHSITKRLLAHFDREDSVDTNWRKIMNRLAASLHIPVYEPLSTGGVFAFTGPTGAGKTTTVAKLAAHAVKDHGIDSVAVVSLDWFQVGGQEILRSVTDILGVDYHALSEGDSLALTLKKLANKRLVLIDTSGSAEALTHWQQTVKSGEIERNIQSVLVLPATMHPAAITQFLQRQKKMNSAVVLSKLDESPCFGGVLEPILKHRWSVWFCTTGQSIPQDIEVADAKKIIKRLSNGLKVEQVTELAEVG